MCVIQKQFYSKFINGTVFQAEMNPGNSSDPKVNVL